MLSSSRCDLKHYLTGSELGQSSQIDMQFSKYVIQHHIIDLKLARAKDIELIFA
jgi:hypothetical protein